MDLLGDIATLISEYRDGILTVCYVLLSTATTVHIIIHKRDTKAATGWIGLAWLSPFLGAIIYFSFGVNRIQRRAIRLAVSDTWSQSDFETTVTPEEQARWELEQERFPVFEDMNLLTQHLTQRDLAPGNTVTPLINGDAAFPAMLEAIATARKSVSLASYIFDNDRAGNLFLEALKNASERGVEVRVLIDGVGARYSRPSMVKCLRKAGVRCGVFLPTQLPRLPTYSNLRNHRKILVVDGRIGFTGGTNIRASHCMEWEQKDYAQCLHFKLEGPVVASLQRTFTIDWAFATDEILSGDLWFPTLERCGQVWARGVVHGPDEDFERLSDLLVGAVSSARQRVRIATPYFLPTQALVQCLGVAAMRGVEVDILLPGRCNIRVVEWAMAPQLWDVVSKRCRVHLSPEPFDHSKLMVVDDAWSLIGSTNWDPRSLRLNFEFNVECYDDDLAKELVDIFDQKLKLAHRVTLEELAMRSRWRRLRDGFASLATPYL